MYAQIAVSLPCGPSTDEFRGGSGGFWAEEEKWGFRKEISVYRLEAVPSMCYYSNSMSQARKTCLGKVGTLGRPTMWHPFTLMGLKEWLVPQSGGEPVTGLVSGSSFVQSKSAVPLWPFT